MPMLTLVLMLIVIELVGRADRLTDLSRQVLDRSVAADIVLENRELIAAEASHHIGVAHARRQPLRHRAQELVAGRMTERVIDVLEMVDIEIVQGKGRAASTRAGEFERQPLEEGGAVGQAGQRVGSRHARDLLLGKFLPGDVAEEPDSPKVFLVWIVQRARMPIDDAAVEKFDLLVALHVRMLIEIVDAGKKFALVLRLLGNDRERGFIQA